MKILHIISLLALVPLLLGCPKNPPADGILIFSKTAEHRHKSIEPAAAQIRYLGKQNNLFWAETSEDATVFTSENLKRYKAVLFLSTTGDILNADQQEAFERYIKEGGGFIGVHAATDTEKEWDWYGNLIGAYFNSHPEGLQTASVIIKDSTHLATKTLPNPWQVTDELYNFKNISDQIHVLAMLDEATYKGGSNGADHPIAWTKELNEGRMFYTGLGHTAQMYSNEIFLNHLLGGITYVLMGH